MIDFPFRTTAIRVVQPLGVFYVAALPAELLLNVAFSDTMKAFQKADEAGYSLEGTQRVVQEKRLSQIAGYISRQDSSFPNSIILAANFREDGFIEEDDDSDIPNFPYSSDRWIIEEDEAGRVTLLVPTAKKLAAIIDGQHRLFAFAKVEDKIRLQMQMVCSIYVDLPKPYQAQLFATINSTQKPVDKSLTFELYGYNINDEPPKYWTPDKLAVFLTRRLAVENNSPLRGRIAIAPMKDKELADLLTGKLWKVSTATIVEGILRLFSTNPARDTQMLLASYQKERAELKNGSLDKSPLRNLYVDGNDALIFAMVLNFLLACDSCFWDKAKEDSFIIKTVGVQALFDILRKYMASQAIEKKNISVSFFANTLNKASQIDFSSEKFRNASGSGRSTIRKSIEELCMF
ncbi:DNA phosphorothioation-associated DGQHR protein 1 [Gluconobacter oxydans]|uniref:DNA phosphorothioation-associated DGQHR protein 1 n=1 Tax=Gluconobacter oxydans TaxID=442 RepID=UPI0039E7A3C3